MSGLILECHYRGARIYHDPHHDEYAVWFRDGLNDANRLGDQYKCYLTLSGAKQAIDWYLDRDKQAGQKN